MAMKNGCFSLMRARSIDYSTNSSMNDFGFILNSPRKHFSLKFNSFVVFCSFVICLLCRGHFIFDLSIKALALSYCFQLLSRIDFFFPIFLSVNPILDFSSATDPLLAV